jgi:hypothetical protein
MSTSFSLFLKTEKPITEVKTCLERILNCPLEQSTYTDLECYFAILLGLSIALHSDVDYDDDYGITFSQYNYQIMADYIKPSFYGEYRGEWEPSVLIIIADMLYKDLNCECIVVRNLSTVLTKFPQDNNGE